MSNYLHVGLRERLRNTLLNRKFGPLELRLRDEKVKLAENILQSQLEKAEWDEVNRMPTGWLPLCKEVRMGMENSSAYQPVDLPFSRPVPSFIFGKIYRTTDLTNEQEVERDRLRAATDEIKVLRAKTKAELDATLASYRTVEKLVGGWPEVEPIVSEVIGVSVSKTLPAITHLNVLLDLPPETTT